MSPDPTALRVALWRALHAQVDAKPHLIEDEVGLRLADPAEGWRQRPDMDPEGTRGFRGGVVARARFVEDLVEAQFRRGVMQYVILGAGLDSFAQRCGDRFAGLRIFEVDMPGTQAWKKQRLADLGLGTGAELRFVPVDFEAGELWWEKLAGAGFDSAKPAIVASTGVSLYLSRDAIVATLRKAAMLAPGSTFAMTFYLPLELVEAAERPLLAMVIQRARAAGTPFLSFFRPSEIQALALEAGFKKVEHVSRAGLIQRYFLGRRDGLLPASGEEFLIATT